MKILHIHPAMSGGGIEAMICGLANEMAKTNDVTVCSIFSPNENDIFWNKLCPLVHRISLGKAKQGFSLKTIYQIYELIRKGKYEAVNMHGFFYYYVLPVYTLRRKTCFFYTIHSEAHHENGSWSRYVFPLKKLAFTKGYAHPITISSTSNDSFKRLYGIDGKIIENGIPKPVITNHFNLVEQYRITSNTKVFVHPGRINKAKNQVVLCQVFNTLIEKGRDVVLVIAGSIQERVIYEALQPYFSDRIRYVGERSDIPELLSRCDGLCLPSIWEGLPVTLLEALSVGCVPICSPVGGIVDVIQNGKNGILSKSSSYNDYLEAVETYLALAEVELVRLKENATKSFEPYEITKTASKYLDYYQNH